MSAQQLTNELTLAAATHGVPQHCIGGLVRYIVHGIPAGSFLQAVLSNDLMDALGRADEDNLYALPRYGRFLYNDVPSGCHGSPGAYAAWIKRGGLFGRPDDNAQADAEEADDLRRANPLEPGFRRLA